MGFWRRKKKKKTTTKYLQDSLAQWKASSFFRLELSVHDMKGREEQARWVGCRNTGNFEQNTWNSPLAQSSWHVKLTIIIPVENTHPVHRHEMTYLQDDDLPCITKTTWTAPRCQVALTNRFVNKCIFLIKNEMDNMFIK